MIAKATLPEGWEATVIGSTLCPFPLNMSSKEDPMIQKENSLLENMETKRKWLWNCIKKLLKFISRDWQQDQTISQSSCLSYPRQSPLNRWQVISNQWFMFNSLQTEDTLCLGPSTSQLSCGMDIQENSCALSEDTLVLSIRSPGQPTPDIWSRPARTPLLNCGTSKPENWWGTFLVMPMKSMLLTGVATERK